MSARAGSGFTIRGRHVLFAMLGFLLTVIAVNVAFAVIAVRSFPGEDVSRSYLQGLNYNETLAERRAQSALGWRVAAALQGEADHARLLVTLRDGEGGPLRGAEVGGELRWPADAKRDRALVFTPAGDGRYIAELGLLEEGRWRLRARVQNSQGRALDFESELLWPTAR